MSLKPGRSAGSFASPDRKASRKLIRGRRLSSTTTRPNPFASVVSRCSGSFSGRGASGGGIWRRKASVSGISGTVLARLLRRGGRGFLRRGHDFQQHAIVVIEKIRHHVANLISCDFQVVSQIRIE